MSNMTDESLMPYGKFEGQKMANVPAKYLLWLYDENKCTGNVRQYIKDNLDVLRSEVK
jgi:uncharacterized protein (DUF3820 family)